MEEFLYAHPDIEDVQVVGVPDERYGEELCAWVRLRAGAEALDADAVRAFCQGRLAHFKVPRYVLVVDEFPMTVTGKVQKFLMREQAVERLGLREAAARRPSWTAPAPSGRWYDACRGDRPRRRGLRVPQRG